MRNLTNHLVTEFDDQSAVQMVDLTTGELHGRAPVDLFGAVEQYPAFGDFPAEGKENVLYVDQSTEPFKGYVWDGTEYQQLGGQNLDVVVEPISYTPTESGNTENLNSIVVDPEGNIWVIDFEGDASLLELSKHLEVLLTIEPVPTETGNTTNLGTVFEAEDGKKYVVDRQGNAIVVDEPVELCAPGAVQAFNEGVGSYPLAPGGDFNNVVVLSGAQTDVTLQAAIDAAATDSIIKVEGVSTLSATVQVNKAVVIDFDGNAVNSTAAAPTLMFNVTAPAVLKNADYSHIKTNSSVDSIINLNSTTGRAYAIDSKFGTGEFAITARGEYGVYGNEFNYIGASLTNSHRYFGIYGNQGESFIHNNTFSAIPVASGTRYTNFILMSQQAGTTYDGKLFITNNVQVGGSLRQFFLHEAGATNGLELIVANNEFDDLNGGIGIISPALYNSYSKIGIFNNTQGPSAVGNFKGVFFVDGSGTLSPDVEFLYGGNTTEGGELRADYLPMTETGGNTIAARGTVVVEEPIACPDLFEALEQLGLTLQEYADQPIFIVDQEGTPIAGAGTEDDPFVVPFTPPQLPAYAADVATADGGEYEGQLLYVTDSGNETGEILEVYAWIGDRWAQYPASATTPEVEGLVAIVPVVYNGSAFIPAQADSPQNLADLVELPDGTRYHDGKITWENHGLQIGKWYYLSQTIPGALVAGLPADGWAQQILFVETESIVHLDIEQGFEVFVTATAP